MLICPARSLRGLRARVGWAGRASLGLSAWAKSCARHAHAAMMQQRFCPPSYGAFESSTVIGWAEDCGRVPAAARGAMRSAARCRGRHERELASNELCSSLHHLISGRTVLARTHIPHTCGEESHVGMGPIYKTAVVLARGWHGHHPSRADRGKCRSAGASVAFVTLLP